MTLIISIKKNHSKNNDKDSMQYVMTPHLSNKSLYIF